MKRSRSGSGCTGGACEARQGSRREGRDARDSNLCSGPQELRASGSRGSPSEAAQHVRCRNNSRAPSPLPACSSSFPRAHLCACGSSDGDGLRSAPPAPGSGNGACTKVAVSPSGSRHQMQQACGVPPSPPEQALRARSSGEGSSAGAEAHPAGCAHVMSWHASSSSMQRWRVACAPASSCSSCSCAGGGGSCRACLGEAAAGSGRWAAARSYSFSDSNSFSANGSSCSRCITSVSAPCRSCCALRSYATACSTCSTSTHSAASGSLPAPPCGNQRAYCSSNTCSKGSTQRVLKACDSQCTTRNDCAARRQGYAGSSSSTWVASSSFCACSSIQACSSDSFARRAREDSFDACSSTGSNCCVGCCSFSSGPDACSACLPLCASFTPAGAHCLLADSNCCSSRCGSSSRERVDWRRETGWDAAAATLLRSRSSKLASSDAVAPSPTSFFRCDGAAAERGGMHSRHEKILSGSRCGSRTFGSRRRNGMHCSRSGDAAAALASAAVMSRAPACEEETLSTTAGVSPASPFEKNFKAASSRFSCSHHTQATAAGPEATEASTACSAASTTSAEAAKACAPFSKATVEAGMCLTVVVTAEAASTTAAKDASEKVAITVTGAAAVAKHRVEAVHASSVSAAAAPAVGKAATALLRAHAVTAAAPAKAAAPPMAKKGTEGGRETGVAWREAIHAAEGAAGETAGGAAAAAADGEIAVAPAAKRREAKTPATAGKRGDAAASDSEAARGRSATEAAGASPSRSESAASSCRSRRSKCGKSSACGMARSPLMKSQKCCSQQHGALSPCAAAADFAASLRTAAPSSCAPTSPDAAAATAWPGGHRGRGAVAVPSSFLPCSSSTRFVVCRLGKEKEKLLPRNEEECERSLCCMDHLGCAWRPSRPLALHLRKLLQQTIFSSSRYKLCMHSISSKEGKNWIRCMLRRSSSMSRTGHAQPTPAGGAAAAAAGAAVPAEEAASAARSRQGAGRTPAAAAAARATAQEAAPLAAYEEAAEVVGPQAAGLQAWVHVCCAKERAARASAGKAAAATPAPEAGEARERGGGATAAERAALQEKRSRRELPRSASEFWLLQQQQRSGTQTSGSCAERQEQRSRQQCCSSEQHELPQHGDQDNCILQLPRQQHPHSHYIHKTRRQATEQRQDKPSGSNSPDHTGLLQQQEQKQSSQRPPQHRCQPQGQCRRQQQNSAGEDKHKQQTRQQQERRATAAAWTPQEEQHQGIPVFVFHTEDFAAAEWRRWRDLARLSEMADDREAEVLFTRPEKWVPQGGRSTDTRKRVVLADEATMQQSGLYMRYRRRIKRAAAQLSRRAKEEEVSVEEEDETAAAEERRETSVGEEGAANAAAAAHTAAAGAADAATLCRADCNRKEETSLDAAAEAAAWGSGFACVTTTAATGRRYHVKNEGEVCVPFSDRGEKIPLLAAESLGASALKMTSGSGRDGATEVRQQRPKRKHEAIAETEGAEKAGNKELKDLRSRTRLLQTLARIITPYLDI